MEQNWKVEISDSKGDVKYLAETFGSEEQAVALAKTFEEKRKLDRSSEKFVNEGGLIVYSR